MGSLLWDCFNIIQFAVCRRCFLVVAMVAVLLVAAVEMQDGTNAFTPALFLHLLTMIMLNIATVSQLSKGVFKHSRTLHLLLDVFICLVDRMMFDSQGARFRPSQKIRAKLQKMDGDDARLFLLRLTSRILALACWN